MRFLISVCLASLALAGCMPTQDITAAGPDAGAKIAENSAINAVAADDTSSSNTPMIMASAYAPPVDAPLPPPRPDFEGVTPASRALGAVVADAQNVDKALDEHAQKPAAKDAPALVVGAVDADEDEGEPQASAVQMASLAVAGHEPESFARARIIPPRAAGPSPGYYAAYDDTNVSCFPPALHDALNTIASHYGKPVEVTSGKRNRGRAHSMHRYCLAADIRVEGIGPQALAAFARNVEGVNGVGTYRYNTVTHIDVRQEKMAWRY
jgi:Peptidase M15